MSALNAVERSIPRNDDTLQFAVRLPYYTPLQPIRKQLSRTRRVRGQPVPISPATTSASPSSPVSPFSHVPVLTNGAGSLPSPYPSPTQAESARLVERKIVNQTCEQHEQDLYGRIEDQKIPHCPKDRVVEFTLSEYGTPPEDFVKEILHFCQRFFPNIPFVAKPSFAVVKPMKHLSLTRSKPNLLTPWEADDLFDGLDAVSASFPPYVWNIITFTKELVSGDALDDLADGGPREVDFSYFTSSWTDMDYPASVDVNGCSKRYLAMISTAPFGRLEDDRDGTILRRTLRNTASLIMHQLAIEECVTFECLMNKFTLPQDNTELKLDGVLSPCPICLLKLASCCFSRQNECLQWFKGLELFFEYLVNRGLTAFTGDLDWYRSATKSIRDMKSRAELKTIVESFDEKKTRRQQEQATSSEDEGSSEDEEEEDWSTRLRGSNYRTSGPRPKRVLQDDDRRQTSPDAESQSEADPNEDRSYVPRRSRPSKRRRATQDEGDENTKEDDEESKDEENEEGEKKSTSRRRRQRKKSGHEFGGEGSAGEDGADKDDKEKPDRKRAHKQRHRGKNKSGDAENAASSPTQPQEPSTILPPVKPPPPDTVGLRFSVACQALLKSAAAAKTTQIKIPGDSQETCDAFLARVCPRLVRGFPDKRFFLCSADPLLAGAEEGFRFESEDQLGEIVTDHLAEESRTLYICCEAAVAADEE